MSCRRFFTKLERELLLECRRHTCQSSFLNCTIEPLEGVPCWRLESRRESTMQRHNDLVSVQPEGTVATSLEAFLQSPKRVGTVLADPPWQFSNRTGKMAPEHRRLHRYQTMKIDEICALPVAKIAADKSHLYLWCPNALIQWGL